MKKQKFQIKSKDENRKTKNIIIIIIKKYNPVENQKVKSGIFSIPRAPLRFVPCVGGYLNSNVFMR